MQSDPLLRQIAEKIDDEDSVLEFHDGMEAPKGDPEYEKTGGDEETTKETSVEARATDEKNVNNIRRTSADHIHEMMKAAELLPEDEVISEAQRVQAFFQVLADYMRTHREETLSAMMIQKGRTVRAKVELHDMTRHQKERSIKEQLKRFTTELRKGLASRKKTIAYLHEENRVQLGIETFVIPGRDWTISSPYAEDKEEMLAAYTAFIEARKKLTQANLRLVKDIASNRLPIAKGMELADLIHFGTEGLMRAINTFDPTRGIQFSTYVYTWIEQVIDRAIEKNKRMVRRVAINLEAKFGEIESVKIIFQQTQGCPPSPEELLAKLRANDEKRHQKRMEKRGMPPRDEKVKYFWTREKLQEFFAKYEIGNEASLDKHFSASRGEHDELPGTLLDLLPDTGPMGQQDRVEQARHDLRVLFAEAGLTPMEEEIIIRRKLNGRDSLREIGEGLTKVLSSERVRQIEAAAMAKLRRAGVRQKNRSEELMA